MVAFGGVKHLLLKATEWVSNRLATHVLFCGQSTLQAAVDAGVASAQKSRVLGKGTISGVDIEEFSPDESGQLRAKQRRAWNVDDTQIVVGFVGRHILHKGVATLMEAWRSLDDEVRAGAKLLLFGGAVRGEEATQKIVDAAVADDIGVKDIGWIEDMVSAYSGMDILVLPSWREGFPYAILEAQAMRLPVVTTRVTGTLDAVEHEVTGLMVPLRDPAALADAMSRLIRSPEDRKLFGERGRERVLNEFTREKVLQHVVDFYDTVLASSLSG